MALNVWRGRPASSFFRLPPHLRSAVFHANAVRPFSATTSRKLTLVDVAVSAPTALIDGIHSLGLPWYASIPVTAALVRGILIHYLVTRPNRGKTKIRSQLTPLAAAQFQIDINSPEAQQSYQRLGIDNPRAGISGPSRWVLWVWQKWYQIPVVWRVGRQFGAPALTGRSILSLGTLLVFMEAIRKKCGTSEGLFSLVMRPVQETAHREMPDVFAAAPPRPNVHRDLAELYAEKAEAARAAHLKATQAGSGIDSGAVQLHADQQRLVDNLSDEGLVVAPDLTDSFGSGATNLDAVTSSVDPSLHTEGLSWCTDLTMSDPTHTLPVLLTFTMVATTLLRPSIGRVLPAEKYNFDIKLYADAPASGTTASKTTAAAPTSTALSGVRGFFNRVSFAQRVGICVAGAFGFVSTNMPAAVLLYIIANFWTGWLQGRWLDYKDPIHPGIQPCARSIRVKTRRQFSEM